jgi:hypothetical protein
MHYNTLKATPKRKEPIMEEYTFDSTYVISKANYDEFISDAEKFAIASYTIPAFILPDFYKMIDISKDIAIKVVWKPGTTVRQIKEFDKTWFLKNYSRP